MRRFAVSVSLVCLTLVACSGGASEPPLAELPLRDALGADPAVIASMPEETRRRLGERFEEARAAGDAEEHVARDPDGSPVAEVRGVDTARAAAGHDALVAASLAPEAETLAVHPLSGSIATEHAPLPPLEGEPATDTAATEARALSGHAGAVVARLLHDAHGTHLVRVVGWPVGAVARGDSVYVNAAWLVALSTPEGLDAGLPKITTVKVVPEALLGNPYLTYTSLEACTNDVERRCGGCISSGACGDGPILSDFSDEKSECTFLAADPNRPAELCALALMSIATVSQCVKTGSGCSLPSTNNTSSSLASAASFVSSITCVNSLDACVSGTGKSPSRAADGGLSAGVSVNVPSSSGCQDPFSSCASACDGVSTACSSDSCSGSSSDSSDSCTSCDSCSSCSGCDSSSSSSGSCSDCNNQNCVVGRSPGTPPVDTAAWLLLPLATLLLRSRRLS